MEAKVYSDPKEFYRENSDFLYGKELENNLQIGIMEGIRHDESAGDNFLCSVLEKNLPVLVAMMTPPFDLLVCSEDVNREAVSLLIDSIISEDVGVAGVLAENDVARLFRSLWEQITGAELEPFRDERIYKLTECRDIPRAEGEIRKATEDDVDLLVRWNLEFHKDIGEEMGEDRARDMIVNILDQTYVWYDEGIVSLCSSSRETRNGRMINMVYTPPEQRSKGYASSLVKSRCSEILEREKPYCGLFTDLANPVSNSIYRKIGFEPVMDLIHYKAG